MSLDFWLGHLDNVIIEGDAQIITDHLLMEESSFAHFGEVMINDCKFLLSGFRFLLSTTLNVAVVPQLTFKQEKLSLADYQVWLVDVPPNVFSVVLSSFIFIHQYSHLGMFLQKKIHKKIARKWRWRSPIIQTCSPFLQLSS